ncbi:MAG: nitroreductase [Candidatus Woykebacteria bacterium GWB1_45_5]|uniref:Nitroreductase n=2 Tax=Candidatus Woykeibacteriota TaxID=1817899 RepID=A0A1G1W2Q9_9BACT|nr:MAG: nitroreductase [Candidatus Woykebacteria bacterium GWA1_44_8]OGY24234.1 MAG: nitroreductase [Candidatus Woykebacteria bacterium GWB1_45_5]
MEFQKLLKERHSIRVYQDKPVEEEKLNQILEEARSAPSAGNLQAYKICVVKDKKAREKIAEAANQEFVAQAPVVLVFLQDPNQSSQKYNRRGEELYSLQDATIACAYAQLAAADLGLGSVWVGAFDEEEVAKIIGVPSNLRPIAILPIGYPAEKPAAKSHRPLDELVWEK